MSKSVKDTLEEMLGILKEGQMTEGQKIYFADSVVTQEGDQGGGLCQLHHRRRCYFWKHQFLRLGADRQIEERTNHQPRASRQNGLAGRQDRQRALLP